MHRLVCSSSCRHLSLRHLQPRQPLPWTSLPPVSLRLTAVPLGRGYAQSAGGPQKDAQKALEKAAGKDDGQGKSLKTELKEQRERDWAIIKQLLPNVWPKGDSNTKTRVVLALGLLIAGKVLNVQVPFFFKEIVDSFNIPLEQLSAEQTVFAVAGTAVVGYGLARTFSTIFSELRNAVFANVAQRAIRRVARNVFTHLLNLDAQFHLSRQTGGLTRAVDRGTKGISFLLTSLVFHVVPTALEISMVCGVLTYSFGINYASITLATMAGYSWFTVRTTAWRTKFRQQANQADNAAASTSLDSLINYEAVKHFNNEAYQVKHFDNALGRYEKASVKIATSLALLNSGQSVIFTGALTLMMWMAAQGVLAGTMTVGDLVMINQLVFQLSLPLNFLGTVYRELRQSLIDMDVMFSLQNSEMKIKSLPEAPPLNVTQGQVRFENVSFGYIPDRPIFKNASFTIPAGKKVAIVGPSGSGKSTVFRLLFRLYQMDGGRITIDGQDITEVDLESVRRALAVVPQDTPLFNADIMHNIRYGQLDATDDEVKEAAGTANIYDAIERLPAKWATQVGERGMMISGGEKQRVALARVLLKDAPIFFFDEATSALDTYTENEVMRNINSILMLKKRTSIFVAHRLKTVADADHIIVLSDGAVAEEGNHSELLERGGLYARLWETQQETEAKRLLNPGIEEEEMSRSGRDRVAEQQKSA